MIQLSKARASLAHTNLRYETHGDKQVPKVDLKLVADFDYEVLDRVHPELRAAFYREQRASDDVDLVAKSQKAEPRVLRFPSIEQPLRWEKDFTGYTLQIEHGSRGDDSALLFQDVKVDSIQMTLRDGGSVQLSLRAIVDPNGKLNEIASHGKSEVEVTLTPPKADHKQQELKAA